MSPQTVKESTFDDIAEAYARANGPFEIAKDGQPSFVIMCTSDLEEEEPLSGAQLQQLEKDYIQSQQGETSDAFESLAEIRAAYGLWRSSCRMRAQERYELDSLHRMKSLRYMTV